MHRFHVPLVAFLALSAYAAPLNIAEDDASGYGGSWAQNGGSGFRDWTFTNEGNEADRHSGFFIATTDNNKDLNGIAKDGKAFGLFANGSGFEHAVAYRSFEKPLQVGDSFSFMVETGQFEKKSEKDTAGGGAIGLVLRSGNANSSVEDYNKGAMFEIGHYQGKSTYQVFDGSEKSDSGVPFTEDGITVTVTVTGSDTYDLEIQTMKDKNVTQLPGRKFSSSGDVESFAIFNRNGEKHDAYFNQFQVARDEK
ncbi:MAG TPA: hypothetical protein VG095_04140 [Chthoniobacterales bacterium]|nr:hypothetical protein [Chthoniobacterales bacterium]